MYQVQEKCLVANIPTEVIKTFVIKKDAVNYKNKLHKERNTHHLYRSFKYKVAKI